MSAPRRRTMRRTLTMGGAAAAALTLVVSMFAVPAAFAEELDSTDTTAVAEVVVENADEQNAEATNEDVNEPVVEEAPAAPAEDAETTPEPEALPEVEGPSEPTADSTEADTTEQVESKTEASTESNTATTQQRTQAVVQAAVVDIPEEVMRFIPGDCQEGRVSGGVSLYYPTTVPATYVMTVTEVGGSYSRTTSLVQNENDPPGTLEGFIPEDMQVNVTVSFDGTVVASIDEFTANCIAETSAFLWTECVPGQQVTAFITLSVDSRQTATQAAYVTANGQTVHDVGLVIQDQQLVVFNYTESFVVSPGDNLSAYVTTDLGTTQLYTLDNVEADCDVPTYVEPNPTATISANMEDQTITIVGSNPVGEGETTGTVSFTAQVATIYSNISVPGTPLTLEPGQSDSATWDYPFCFYYPHGTIATLQVIWNDTIFTQSTVTVVCELEYVEPNPSGWFTFDDETDLISVIGDNSVNNGFYTDDAELNMVLVGTPDVVLQPAVTIPGDDIGSGLVPFNPCAHGENGDLLTLELRYGNIVLDSEVITVTDCEPEDVYGPPEPAANLTIDESDGSITLDASNPVPDGATFTDAVTLVIDVDGQPAGTVTLKSGETLSDYPITGFDLCDGVEHTVTVSVLDGDLLDSQTVTTTCGDDGTGNGGGNGNGNGDGNSDGDGECPDGRTPNADRPGKPGATFTPNGCKPNGFDVNKPTKGSGTPVGYTTAGLADTGDPHRDAVFVAGALAALSICGAIGMIRRARRA